MKTRLKAALAVDITVSCLADCAHIVDGSTLSVPVLTTPVKGAACTLVK